MNNTALQQDADKNASGSKRRGEILRGSIFLTLGAMIWGCAFGWMIASVSIQRESGLE